MQFLLPLFRLECELRFQRKYFTRQQDRVCVLWKGRQIKGVRFPVDISFYSVLFNETAVLHSYIRNWRSGE